MPGTVEGKTGAAALERRRLHDESLLAKYEYGKCKTCCRGHAMACNPRSISESLPLLFVSSSGFSEPQAVSRSVVHERGRELERARRLSAARLASGLRH